MIETFLQPGRTFDQFACGNCNQRAFSSARQVAEGSITADPLFICGASGLGKSHLLNAIGHHVLSRNQSTRIIYCSADKFMHSFINCLRANQVHEFREYFGTADLLLVDDIQFFASKERSQQDFCACTTEFQAVRPGLFLPATDHSQSCQNFQMNYSPDFQVGLLLNFQHRTMRLKE